ncbi:DGQHR domain-containing protein [Stieleria sp. TO1_6]|uniref:DNA sulfur modification protein DndB n=1 Tax=Stieleria tagensis TaxID=2956795 RepID=UPI00209A6C44|nr:DNA sulfur modification protein DndB [Stieleria tagensis]MCO8123528.1 DGQHR domain-containing protein [Stieleria tagensis]
MKLFPSIQGTVGTWRYYSTKMTAADLASQVKFASEVWESKALDLWIQRALNDSRAKKDISAYLARHEDRFFNSIVVAAIEGNPKFFSVSIADDPQFALIADDRMNSSFGVLRFDGTQKYYALDGQHRLKAIKALIENETEFVAPQGFEDEEFSVIIVVQKADESRDEFMKKYRRLFSHLNRHAKPMDKATTIIMEEDDAFAICTRRLIQEHSFFSWADGESTRVRCQGTESMSVNESYFTNIITLYEMTIDLLSTPSRQNSDEWGDRGKKYKAIRPTDDVLDSLYDELVTYWDAILDEFSVFYTETRLMRTNLAEEHDVDSEISTNHLLFRPIGQDLLAKLIRCQLNSKMTDPDVVSPQEIRSALAGLAKAEWRLFNAPWRNLFFVYQSEDKWRMRSEDRKKVQTEGLRLMRWIVGLDSYGNEDDLIDQIKTPWRELLLNVTDDEADEMWSEIEGQAFSFRS